MAKSISRYLADISSTSGVLDGTLSTAAQTNITSLGTLSSLTVSGAMNGTLSTAAQPNITSVGTLTTLAMGGSITRTGDLTLDVSGSIILDADSGGDILLKDGGTDYGKFSILNGDWVLTQPTANKDILFKGNDGNALTALTLDMSDAGTAIFNHDAHLLDNGKLVLGTGADTQMYYDGSRLNINNTGDVVFDTSGNIYLDADGGKVYLQDAGTEKIRFVMDNAGYVQIYSAVSNDDIKIQGNDGGSVVDALVFDMSEAGAATFNAELIAPNGATEGYHIKQTGGTATPRITNDANNWTILRPGASGSDVAINNYANSANLVVFTDEGGVGIGASPAYGKLDIRQTGTGAQDRGLYVEVSPSSSGSNLNAALINAGNGNLTGTVVRIHHESPAANQKLLSLDTTGSNTEKFWVDEDGDGYFAGIVTTPGRPSFLARNSQNTGLNAHSSAHTVQYGSHSVLHNIGSHYDTSNYKFVAPVAGVYFFSANLRVDGFSGNYSYLTLKHYSSSNVQQSDKGRDLQDGNNSTYMNHIVTAVVNLAVGDYVFMEYIGNGDTSVNLDSDSWFSGYLIG